LKGHMPKKEAAVKTIQMGSKVEEKVPCSECKKEVGAQERHVFKGKSNTDIYYCDSCVEKINEALANETKNPNIITAVLVGAMAGFIGTIGWYLFVILTQYQIGYIGIALGWLIGTAYVKGAGEKRGHQLQLLAAITTLISLLGADLFIFTHFSAEYFNSEFGIQVSSLDIILSFLVDNTEGMRSLFLQDFLSSVASPIGLLIWGISIFTAYSIPKPRVLSTK